MVGVVVVGAVAAGDEAVVEDPGDSADFAGELQAASNTLDTASKGRIQSFRERLLCLLTLDVVLTLECPAHSRCPVRARIVLDVIGVSAASSKTRLPTRYR